MGGSSVIIFFKVEETEIRISRVPQWDGEGKEEVRDAFERIFLKFTVESIGLRLLEMKMERQENEDWDIW